MGEGKILIKNTLIYTIGNLGSKLFSFLLLPLYSFYLTKSELGTYDLLITTVNLIVPFVTIQISDATYRWLVDSQKNKSSESISITNGLFIICCCSVFFYIIYFILALLIKFQFAYQFGIVLLLSIFLPFFQQIIRGLGKIKLYSLVGAINTFLIAVFAVLFLLVFKKGLIGLLWAVIIANFLALLFAIYASNIYSLVSIKKLDRNLMRSMISFSWPLIPNSISWWLISVADRYIILFFLGTEANGVYAISAKFATIVAIINSVFMLAWQDHAVSSNQKPADSNFNSNVFSKFIKFEFALIIFLIAISKLVVFYLVDKAFADSWKYMALLYIAVAFSSFSAYVGVGYQRQKNTIGVFTTTLVGACVNLVVSICLIKYVGLYATGIGSMLSFIVVYLIRIRRTRSFFFIAVNNRLLWSLTIVALLIAGVATISKTATTLVNIFVSIVLGLWLNSEILTKAVKFCQLKFRLILRKK
jgi:O-antigen/teichoic acid export membrane protein